MRPKPTIFLASTMGLAARPAIIREFAPYIWDPMVHLPDPVTKSLPKAELIEKACRDQIQRSCLFLCILDEKPGESKAFPSTKTIVSILEIELFQALIHRIPIHIFCLPGFESNLRLKSLVDLITQSSLGQVAQCDEKNLDHLIEAIIKRHRSCLNRIWYFSPTFLDMTHVPNITVKFLDGKYQQYALHFESDAVRGAYAALKDQDRATQLALLWAAARHLCSRPYEHENDDETRELWHLMLAAWARSAAWYGLHGSLPVSRLAAVNSLIELHEIRLREDGRYRAAWAHRNVRGGRASELYSIAKRRVSGTARRLLLNEALRDIHAELYKDPVATPGLLGIRASIHLALRQLDSAISDYQEVLLLRQRQDASPSEIGEAMSQLGWAQFRQWHLSTGLSNLERGVELMRVPDGERPDFTTRALRKLALAYGLLLRFPPAIRTAREACELANARRTYGQLSRGWAVLCSLLTLVASAQAALGKRSATW